MKASGAVGGGGRRAPDVLAASLICVSGQIVWVGRRAAGTGSWHEYPRGGSRNVLTLDERLESLNPHVRYWEEGTEVQEGRSNVRTEARLEEPCELMDKGLEVTQLVMLVYRMAGPGAPGAQPTNQVEGFVAPV